MGAPALQSEVGAFCPNMRLPAAQAADPVAAQRHWAGESGQVRNTSPPHSTMAA